MALQRLRMSPLKHSKRKQSESTLRGAVRNNQKRDARIELHSGADFFSGGSVPIQKIR
jgi:hypothetical protein